MNSERAAFRSKTVQAIVTVLGRRDEPDADTPSRPVWSCAGKIPDPNKALIRGQEGSRRQQEAARDPQHR
jgi:hypothetical protein